MNKTFLTLALGLTLGVSSCREAKEQPRVTPPVEEPKKEEPKQEEKPAQPEAQIVIEEGILKSYPAEKVAADGVVTLDETVKEIAEGAFAGNTKITSLVAPASLTKIGARAFAGATAFKHLDLSKYKPVANHPYPETAADAFVGTPSDKALKTPANPSYTAWFEFAAQHTFTAFDGLQPTDLKGATIKDGELIELPKSFRPSANGLLVLPETVTKLGVDFAHHNTGVKLVYAPAVKEVATGVFTGSGLSYGIFPKLEKIGDASFGELGQVKMLNFPVLKEIGRISFLPGTGRAAQGFTFLSMPQLKTVGSGSFHKALVGMKTLILGAKPTISTVVFNEGDEDEIEGEGVPVIIEALTAFSGSRAKDAVLYVSEADLASYGVADGGTWEGFTVRVRK